MIGGSRASVVVSMITEVNGSLIRQVDHSLTGFHLILTLSHDATSAENVAYTIKEINSYFGCHQYVTATVASVDNYFQVSQIWQRAFGSSEVLFVADTSLKKGSYMYVCKPLN